VFSPTPTPRTLFLAVGDLVRGPLTGRRTSPDRRKTPVAFPQNIDAGVKCGCPIEAIPAEGGAAGPSSQEVLQQSGSDSHTSLFQDAQDSLPPGLLGQRPASAQEQRLSRPMGGTAGRLGPLRRLETSHVSELARSLARSRRWRGLVAGGW